MRVHDLLRELEDRCNSTKKTFKYFEWTPQMRERPIESVEVNWKDNPWIKQLLKESPELIPRPKGCSKVWPKWIYEDK